MDHVELCILIFIWFNIGLYMFDNLNIDMDELSTFALCIGLTVIIIGAPLIFLADFLIEMIERIFGEEVFDDDG